MYNYIYEYQFPPGLSDDPDMVFLMERYWKGLCRCCIVFIVLYCTVLYCTVLHCTVLYCIILCTCAGCRPGGSDRASSSASRSRCPSARPRCSPPSLSSPSSTSPHSPMSPSPVSGKFYHVSACSQDHHYLGSMDGETLCLESLTTQSTSSLL